MTIEEYITTLYFGLGFAILALALSYFLSSKKDDDDYDLFV